MAAPEKPGLTINDAFRVLDKLESEQFESLILVGGQAAAFWIARYGIAEPKALTTKDIDFLLIEQRSRVALDCARVLGGELQVVNDARVPDVARVLVKFDGAEFRIDFLRSLHGIKNRDVSQSKLGIRGEPGGKTFYVMHPALVLASRLSNAFELDGRLTTENLSRVRYSIEAVGAYLAEQLSADRPHFDDVLDSIERTFKLALGSPGLTAWHDYGIDVFSAVPDPAALSQCPPHFLERRYPQMRRLVEKKRARHSRTRLRSAAVRGSSGLD